MKLVCLDLGSNMAMAHNICDVLVTDFKSFDGIRAHRAGAILKWLNKRFGEIKSHHDGAICVVYERPFARGFDATRSGWGLAGLIEAEATNHGWAVTDQTPQAIKKFAIGGRARKKMTSAERREAAAEEKLLMLDAAIRMGYTGDNEHEADAVCLLRYAEANIVVTPAKEKKK